MSKLMFQVEQYKTEAIDILLYYTVHKSQLLLTEQPGNFRNMLPAIDLLRDQIAQIVLECIVICFVINHVQ